MDADAIERADVASRGDEWGEQLWTISEPGVDGEPGWSIDVHAADADEARVKALTVVEATATIADAAAASCPERLVQALDALPADQPITPAVLLKALTA